MLDFSAALTDPSSEEYQIAAENIKALFGGEMENMADIMGAILEKLEVLFEEGSDNSSSGRKRRATSTEAVITSVFSVPISESTDLSKLENDVMSSTATAGNAAIANSDGTFISPDAEITVSVVITEDGETSKGMIKKYANYSSTTEK